MFRTVLLFLLAMVQTVFILLVVTAQVIPVVVYPLCKVIMICAPLLWVLADRYSWMKIKDLWGLILKRGDILLGLAAGVLISVVIIGGYLLFFRNLLTAEYIRSLVPPFVLENLWLSALILSSSNCLIEEYYWRCFLLSEMKTRLGTRNAVILNGLLFGVHHQLLLWAFFPSAITVLFTFGTMLGGWIWSLMRIYGRSIWACVISHLVIDLALFGIGYMILF
mgnify:CR=1 FL=1